MSTAKTAFSNPNKSQIDKFKEAARELETNEDEAAFDRALKKVAKAKPEAKKSEK
ncbi:hypothetical protein [Devosia sp. A449]